MFVIHEYRECIRQLQCVDQPNTLRNYTIWYALSHNIMNYMQMETAGKRQTAFEKPFRLIDTPSCIRSFWVLKALVISLNTIVAMRELINTIGAMRELMLLLYDRHPWGIPDQT